MKLTLTIVQMQVMQARPDENIRRAETRIAEAAQTGSDWICLPEMWTTGFAWNDLPHLADQCAEQRQRLAFLARRHQIWIAGSMLSRNPVTGGLTNSLLLFNAEGHLAAEYAKIHLFAPIYEDRHLQPGTRPVIAETPWGRIGLAICYDLRFPELFHTYALAGVDLVLLSAAFPLARRDDWRSLLRTRAIENQLFVVGVNQAGTEQIPPDLDIPYAGASAVIDPAGRLLHEAGEHEETFTVSLDTA
ncbi:MAG: carbon-nitrogen family hydrolase [Kiritimatiellae bacterium]|nr:carbon-nitrogen family hydrolase [Kiritimatiellia bacterium]